MAGAMLRKEGTGVAATWFTRLLGGIAVLAGFLQLIEFLESYLG